MLLSVCAWFLSFFVVHSLQQTPWWCPVGICTTKQFWSGQEATCKKEATTFTLLHKIYQLLQTSLNLSGIPSLWVCIASHENRSLAMKLFQNFVQIFLVCVFVSFVTLFCETLLALDLTPPVVTLTKTPPSPSNTLTWYFEYRCNERPCDLLCALVEHQEGETVVPEQYV